MSEIYQNFKKSTLCRLALCVLSLFEVCFVLKKVSGVFKHLFQIYVEIERARLTMTLAKIREDQGNVNEAATVLQELQVNMGGGEILLLSTEKHRSLLIFKVFIHKMPTIFVRSKHLVQWRRGKRWNLS